MPQREYISLRKLQLIAAGTAKANALTPPTREAVARMYYSEPEYQLPIIIMSERGELWVDKYYVAYQIGSGDVCYTYLSKHHIEEELASYEEVSRERKCRICLSEDIAGCFAAAQQTMDMNGISYWLDPRWMKGDEKSYRHSPNETK